MSEWQDYFEIEPGLVVGADGEIVNPGPATVQRVAVLRHDAYDQKREWERQQQLLDAVLKKELHKAGERKVSFETGLDRDLVVAVGNNGARTNTDVAGFVEGLATTAIEDEELFAVLAAATGFKRDLIPERLHELFDRYSEEKPTADYIRTSWAKRRAPKRKVVTAPELEEVPA